MAHFDPLEALAALERHRCTHSQWVPTMFSRMLKLPEEDRKRFDLSAHQVAIHAAAPCPRPVKEAMFEWWGPIIYEYYGGSELNGLTYVGPEDWLAHPGTVGRAVMGVLHICDEEGNELPPGEPGLMYFEQESATFHYHKDEGQTRSSRHPSHPNWSALGDVGYLDEEGFLYLTDRATFMIISGGVNIYPREIEDVLVMHPVVDDVAVIGVPNADMGEEVKAIVQLVRGVEGTPALGDELIAFCRERLTHYKCPRSVDFEPQLPGFRPASCTSASCVTATGVTAAWRVDAAGGSTSADLVLFEHGDGGDGLGRRVGAEAALEPVGGAGEVEDAAVLADHEVAAAGPNHTGDGPVEPGGAHGALEVGLEREDATVGRNEPVADPIGVRHQALHRGVQPLAAHGPVELGVTESEDPAVGGDHVVAGARRGDDRIQDRPGQGEMADVAEEGGVPKGRAPGLGW